MRVLAFFDAATNFRYRRPILNYQRCVLNVVSSTWVTPEDKTYRITHLRHDDDTPLGERVGHTRHERMPGQDKYLLRGFQHSLSGGGIVKLVVVRERNKSEPGAIHALQDALNKTVRRVISASFQHHAYADPPTDPHPTCNGFRFCSFLFASPLLLLFCVLFTFGCARQGRNFPPGAWAERRGRFMQRDRHRRQGPTEGFHQWTHVPTHVLPGEAWHVPYVSPGIRQVEASRAQHLNIVCEASHIT